MIDVPDVIGKLLFPRKTVATVYLCPTGYTGLYFMAPELLAVIKGKVFHQQRTRANQAHVALDHVQKLGQLIQTQPAQQTADWCEPRLVRQEPALDITGVHHGAEFQE